MATLEPYPLWTAEDEAAGKYEFGSKVSYEVNINPFEKVFIGYRANSLYKKGYGPPNQNTGWSVDRHYALEWTPSKVYKIGEKVWFEVGDPRKESQYYLYRATVRYWGGHGYPNSEEDDDGIRTWELYYEPIEPRVVTYSYPVRKKVGVWGAIDTGGSSSTGAVYPGITYPEERLLYTNPNNHITYADGINSVYEGNPYDEGVYSFFEKESYGNSAFKPEKHRHKGIHRAQIYKAATNVVPELKAIANRQWYFTHQYNYNQYDYAETPYPFLKIENDYYQGSYGLSSQHYGFSAEIWPHETEFEMIPVPLFIQKRTMDTVAGGGNAVYCSVEESGEAGQYGGNQGGDQPTEPAGPNRPMIIKIRFNSPAFHGRTFKLRINRYFESWYYKKETYYDSDGVAHSYWIQVPNPISSTTQEIMVDTRDSSYSFEGTTDGYFIVKKITLAGVGVNSFVGYSMLGWQFD